MSVLIDGQHNLKADSPLRERYSHSFSQAGLTILHSSSKRQCTFLVIIYILKNKIDSDVERPDAVVQRASL